MWKTFPLHVSKIEAIIPAVGAGSKSIMLSSSGTKKIKSEIQGVLLSLPRAYLPYNSNLLHFTWFDSCKSD